MSSGQLLLMKEERLETIVLNVATIETGVCRVREITKQARTHKYWRRFSKSFSLSPLTISSPFPLSSVSLLSNSSVACQLVLT
jgi:hypothetical protein